MSENTQQNNTQVIYYFADGLFYPDNENYQSIPDGAIAVSEIEFAKAMRRLPGESFTVSHDGNVIIMPVPEMSREQMLMNAERQRKTLIDEALQSISVIQLKLQAGRKLTGEETLRLNHTLDYIDEVEATDISTAPDISWPARPA